jgi:hypothetical protein
VACDARGPGCRVEGRIGSPNKPAASFCELASTGRGSRGSSDLNGRPAAPRPGVARLQVAESVVSVKSATRFYVCKFRDSSISVRSATRLYL